MYLYNLGLLFYKVAQENSEKEALIFRASKNITFGDLNLRSNQIARYLLDNGIKKNDVVGIFNTKHPDFYALMIACLKIGSIYVNIDITSPSERLKKIIVKCSPKLIFFDSSFTHGILEDLKLQCQNVDSEEFGRSLNKFSGDNLEYTAFVCSDNPAYIMFTSGSTGFPKGALMTHHNLLNFICWTKQTYGIEKDDILMNVNPMYFDNSVFDFYASLFNSATMAPVDSETVQQPGKLIDYVDSIKATIWFSVPSLLVFLLTMKVLKKESLDSIRVITFGGEGFPKFRLKELFDLYSDKIRLVNVYGPTECTCICSAYDIKKSDFNDMKSLAPLGFLAPNFDYLIINEESNQSKSGELLLGGPQVGLGYFNDHDRTESSFIKHPYIKDFTKIMYRTGDLVFEDQEGILYITGRIDNQIKHMGYRIELEEIEAAFGTLEYINEVGVVYEKFENGLGQINAFINLKTSVTTDIIRKDIKNILPPYMIPKGITILTTIPKNSNGKLDRIALKILNKKQ